MRTTTIILLTLTMALWAFSRVIFHMISPNFGNRSKNIILNLLILFITLFILFNEIGTLFYFQNVSTFLAQLFLFFFFSFTFKPYTHSINRKFLTAFLFFTSVILLVIQFFVNYYLHASDTCHG